MNRNPMVVIDEFLQCDEAQLRKNAVVALGAIADPERTDRLVDVALKDLQSVRELAEDELVGVINAHDMRIVDLYDQSAGDRPRRAALYALLGRLRAKGASLPSRRGSWRPALSLFSLAYPARGAKFYFRALAAAFGGVLLTSILLVVILGLLAAAKGYQRGLSSDVAEFVFFGALFALAGSLIASARTTAYRLHYSGRVGFLVEVLLTALLGCGAFGVGALVSKLVSGSGGLAGTVVVGVMVVAVVVVSRALSILTVGTARSRIRNFAAAVTTSTSGAIWVCTAIAWWASKSSPTDMTDIASLAWVWILPACGALGAAFASIDARVPFRGHSRAPAIASRSIMAITALLLILLGAGIYLSRAKKGGTVPIAATLDSARGQRRLTVETSPYRVRLNIREQTLLTVTRKYAGRLKLTDQRGKVVFEDSNALTWQRVVPAGSYELDYEWALETELRAEEALPAVLTVLVVPLRRSSIVAAPAGTPTPKRYLDIGFSRRAAHDSGPDVSADIQTRAQMRLDLGDAHARQGEIDDALTDFRLARRIYPNLRIPADTWYTLCWNAVLNGRAAAVVGEACQNAVALKPDDVDKIDARGLAYALTGHRTEAIADFTVYVRNDRVREPEKALRRLWIQRLRAGTKDPVPRSELDELGKEEDSSASD